MWFADTNIFHTNILTQSCEYQPPVELVNWRRHPSWINGINCCADCKLETIVRSSIFMVNHVGIGTFYGAPYIPYTDQDFLSRYYILIEYF